VRAVIQRVTEACVTIEEKVVGKIRAGLCVFLGVSRQDDQNKAHYLADKVATLRIFADEQGKMNHSLIDIQGEILVVSQFTLYGDCKKGNRPSFTEAAPPAEAARLYHDFLQRLRAVGLTGATGQFQTHMSVSLTNDGPVTFILEV